MSSKYLKHVACRSCGSSDANSLYSDGHEYCYSCGTFVPGDSDNKNNTDNKKEFTILTDNNFEKSANIRPLPETYSDLKDRGISAATAKRFGVGVTDGEHTYPYFDKDGHHVANKIRRIYPKGFRWEGEVAQAALFGQNIFPQRDGGGAITIVEGCCDAMAAYEMTGSRYPVVSVHSAGAAPKNVADNFEYLNSYDKIVICFDKDEPKVNPQTGLTSYPGQEAALKVAGMFPIGKVRLLTLQEFKDPNEYLAAGKQAQFIKEWFQAPVFTPSGLKLGKNMWDEIREPKNNKSISYPWASLQKKTYGVRLSEVVIITAETGVGKSSIVREIEGHILKESLEDETKPGIGLLHLEESNSDTALGLMSIEANKPLHLPDVRESVDDKELREYFDKTVNTDRICIWDHFGSNSIHEVLSKIRHMVNLGCKYIVVDHLSIIVSDQAGDERKELDAISTKLKTLAMELNIAVIAIIHQNRQGQIRGSAGVEQLANIVLKLSRETESNSEWRRNVTKILVQKNRFCGITGPGVYVYYNPITARLSELEEEEIRAYEEGGEPGMQELPW